MQHFLVQASNKKGRPRAMSEPVIPQLHTETPAGEPRAHCDVVPVSSPPQASQSRVQSVLMDARHEESSQRLREGPDSDGETFGSLPPAFEPQENTVGPESLDAKTPQIPGLQLGAILQPDQTPGLPDACFRPKHLAAHVSTLCDSDLNPTEVRHAWACMWC